jgi:hypothetical protein
MGSWPGFMIELGVNRDVDIFVDSGTKHRSLLLLIKSGQIAASTTKLIRGFGNNHIFDLYGF